MSEFRIGQAAELLGVSPDTVRRLADGGELQTRRTEGGHRVVDGVALARFVAEHGGTQTTGAIVGQSARNRFPGIITRVVKDSVAAQVEVQAGPHRVVSLMTAEAVDELGLEPGMRAVAVVKATQVVVEVPEAG
ncbi:MAG TPA: TOBE domain-containing protein [Acidimicrobiia bacterium]|nr:TOBE domain-containing protein [Acidimicrobiia bacterium]